MRRTLRWLLYLTSLILGGGALTFFVRPELLSNPVVPFLLSETGHWVSLGVAGFLLFCPIAILVRWWQVHRHAREISYTTESGRVSVSLVAVEEALTRAVENETFVKKAHVRLYEDRVKRQVVIEAVLTFWEVPNVTERNRECQLILRRRFAELMPEQSAVQVDLNVHRITERRDEHRRTEIVKPTTAPTETVLPVAPPSSPDLIPAPFGTWKYPTPLHGVFMPAKPAPSGEGTSDEDLYVGPSYPVESDDDDDSSAQPKVTGKGLPPVGKPASGSKAPTRR